MIEISKGTDGVIHHCDLCEYSTTLPRSLRRHIESKHEGTKQYKCDQCDYAALKSSGLKVHIESKHEGIRYPCDQCDYAATTSSSLKSHVQARHEGITYICDRCDFVASKQSTLKFHIESKHEEIRHELLVFFNLFISNLLGITFSPKTLEQGAFLTQKIPVIRSIIVPLV